MKNLIIFLLFILLTAGCSQHDPDQQDTIVKKIDSPWLFRKMGDNNWLRATVPGTVHTDLLANKLIEDPYFGTNEHDLQWIDKTDWEYKTTLTIDGVLFSKKSIILNFKGLDTYADVYLNGILILSADNMFRSWQVPCKEQLKQGDNELRIVLKSPIRIGLEKLEQQGYPLPASNDQSEIGKLGNKKVSIFTRKAGYHFGWDWGPRLVTSGIWRPVEIISYNKARIENVRLIQHELTKTKSSLTASISLNCISDDDFKIEVDVNGKKTAESVLKAKKGCNTFNLDFAIHEPRLWWPNGLGEQHLYKVKIKIYDEAELIDSEQINYGARSLKLVQKPDPKGDGQHFYFEVNGKPVFAKGTNYIPNDVFLPLIGNDDYERIVKAAADANMNMLRVWGGGIYENDIFYDLCDHYGIMVWQDFMYACSMYPGDTAFLDNARLEAEENVKRLRNHPCLALWCGNNEIAVAWAENEAGKGWGWKERYSTELHKKIWHDYDTLFHKILPEIIKKLDPKTTYWPSSPSAADGKLAGYETNSGDMHYWGVWHGKQPFSDFRKYRARFMSEYGFQSFPELSTVKTYALPKDWDIESKVMASHQRSGIGNLRIKQYMEQDYQIPADFEQFLYVSQLLQAEGIKTAIESHRTDMPYCMGSLYWQLNDCWPVASWSGMDYYGRWKALHYFVKKVFQPEIIAAFQDNDSLEIWAVSDKMIDLDARLVMTLYDFSGNLLWEKSEDFKLTANSSTMFRRYGLADFLKFGPAGKLVLETCLIVDGKNKYKDFHYFVKPKYLQLDDPELKYTLTETNDQFVIKMSCNKLAKNVFFSTDISADHFSDNFFDLIPGNEKVISFPKRCSLETFNKSLKVTYLQKFD
jgi:beta-mannosidase